jgi:hypothetical protein
MWKKVVFSDECSYERGSGRKREWVWRQPDEKWKKEFVQTYSKGKNLTQMVFRAFSGQKGITDLCIMERDPKAKRNGYTSWSYTQALEQVVEDYFETGMIFQQDNARIHTSHHTRAWFAERG